MRKGSVTAEKTVFIAMGSFMLAMLGCTKGKPEGFSSINTMAPKYGVAFQRQCSRVVSTSRPFPKSAIVQKQVQTTRIHRFGPDAPGKAERSIRQEIQQETMVTGEGSPCGMAPISRVSSYFSSDFDALLRYENTSVNKLEGITIPDQSACGALTARRYVSDLKALTSVLLALAPFTNRSGEWAAAHYKKSYAVFAVKSVSPLGRSDEGILTSVVIEGTFQPIEVSNGTQVRGLGAAEVPSFVTGSPLYQGDPLKAEDPNFLPEASFGWVQTALLTNKKDTGTDGRNYPVYQLVVQNWM